MSASTVTDHDNDGNRIIFALGSEIEEQKEGIIEPGCFENQEIVTASGGGNLDDRDDCYRKEIAVHDADDNRLIYAIGSEIEEQKEGIIEPGSFDNQEIVTAAGKGYLDDGEDCYRKEFAVHDADDNRLIFALDSEIEEQKERIIEPGRFENQEIVTAAGKGNLDDRDDCNRKEFAVHDADDNRLIYALGSEIEEQKEGIIEPGRVANQEIVTGKGNLDGREDCYRKELAVVSVSSTESEKQDDDNGFRTPTTLNHKIPAILECPPAPKKTRPPPAQVLRSKRKASPATSRAFSNLELDVSAEIESIFQPISEQKLKKARRDEE